MEIKQSELRGAALPPFRRFILSELKKDKFRLNKVARGNGLHDFRVSARRVHTWMRALGPNFGPQPSKKISKRFLDLLKRTTEWRDRQVQAKLLERWRGFAKGEERKSLELALELLEAEPNVLDKQDTEKLQRRFEKVSKKARKFVKKSSEENKTPLAKLLSKSLSKDVGAFVAAYAAAETKADPRRFHALRIAGKRLRYLIAPCAHLHARVPSVVTELKELQDDLGYLHDLDVLAGKLRKMTHPKEGTEPLKLAVERCLKNRDKMVLQVQRGWFGEHGKSLLEDVRGIGRWLQGL